ncbi:uncharacterized protein BcabD6B2_00310 [Babesia caballi]|uniref:Transmembrane protein, putative n=1 Tax=Babesia caballi TaxID=5871 RepID=A0AAV4LNG4_BABCB|nr:transmembrane protein, putative [Babesia caballi]
MQALFVKPSSNTPGAPNHNCHEPAAAAPFPCRLRLRLPALPRRRLSPLGRSPDGTFATTRHPPPYNYFRHFPTLRFHHQPYRATMMYPGMMEPAPEPPLSATTRMYLRVIGFVAISSAIYFYGDLMDMPEAINLV